MMEKNEIFINCPCCNAKIWIDIESGGILKHEGHSKGKESFGTLMDKYKQQKADKNDALKKAMQEEKKRKELLEKKFKRAVENVEELDEPEKYFDHD